MPTSHRQYTNQQSSRSTSDWKISYKPACIHDCSSLHMLSGRKCGFVRHRTFLIKRCWSDKVMYRTFCRSQDEGLDRCFMFINTLLSRIFWKSHAVLLSEIWDYSITRTRTPPAQLYLIMSYQTLQTAQDGQYQCYFRRSQPQWDRVLLRRYWNIDLHSSDWLSKMCFWTSSPIWQTTSMCRKWRWRRGLCYFALLDQTA